jgi:hypothetical protein
LIDKELIEKIYNESGVHYFNDELRPLLKIAIKELYYSQKQLMMKLRLHHIDRAVFKFRTANESTTIKNTKQYFKACITSAIIEVPFDELSD